MLISFTFVPLRAYYGEIKSIVRMCGVYAKDIFYKMYRQKMVLIFLLSVMSQLDYNTSFILFLFVDLDL